MTSEVLTLWQVDTGQAIVVHLHIFFLGAATIPGAAGGMFFGGFICNRLKLKVRGMLKVSIISCILAMVAVNILWISCEDLTFAGVNKEYEPG